MSLTQVGRGASWLATLRSTASADVTRCTRRLGSGCTACLDDCPVTAIRLEVGEPPDVDPQACIGCGLCAAACPADAFEGVGTSPERLVLAAHGAGDHLAIRCTRAASEESPALGGYVQDVLCLGSIHPETVAAAAAGIRTGGTLELVSARCSRCPVAAARQVEERSGAGRALAAKVAPGVTVSRRETAPHQTATGRIESGPGAVTGLRRLLAHGRSSTDPVSVSRRELFHGFAGRPVLAAREVPAGTEGEVRPIAVEGAVSRPRATLVATAPRVPLPRPQVEEARCAACRACSSACPTGALMWSETSSGSALGVDPQACIACEECVRVCPEGAVSLVCDLQPRRVGATVALAHVSHSTCSRCGDVLGPGEQDRCTRCRSRSSLVEDVWAQYGLG